MGQTQTKNSDNIIPDTDEIVRHARVFSEIVTLSYEDFVKSMADLNALTQKCLDSNGRQLVFAIKKGSDSTMLWKGTVRIACVKLDPETRKIINYRLLNLSQFLRICKTLQCQLTAMDHNTEASCSRTLGLDSSLLLNGVSDFNLDDFEKSTDCCICLERKQDVMLPCTHSYCLPCIEQWNVNNKTCPICRETLASTDDTWVISEAPDSFEINEEICAALMDLTNDDTQKES